MKKLLTEIIEKETLIKLICSNPRNKSVAYKKIIVRPILVKEKLIYQFEYFSSQKNTYENIQPDFVVDSIINIMSTNFKQVDIFTSENDIQILASKITNPRIKKNPPTKETPSLEHNREKQYIIPDNSPCDFLIKLGVMDIDGKVFKKHYSKFRQINRFLEIIDDVYPSLSKSKSSSKDKEPLKIIDFGCGKSYLTFAIYYYFFTIKKMKVDIVGLDLKKDVMDFCNSIAHELGYKNLKFLVGDIVDYKEEWADMVVTLHACDTATDFALINAVKWNSKVILSVPCCQHELFKQINSPINNPILKHGINKDKFVEILTNGLRGLKLESMGYQVSMIEFTSLEHTSKNVMIRAVKSDKPNKKAAQEYAALKSEYNVLPTIDLLSK